MDPRAHRRFLEYQELWARFGRAPQEKLDRATWEALDRELAELEASIAAGGRSPEAAARRAVLRRALLRD